MNDSTSISFVISPSVTNEALNELFAASWPEHHPCNFQPILARSLAYVCAYESVALVGFVNLAWDGGVHAFILDTVVHPRHRRQGIGQELVRQAVDVARQNGVAWVHVDYEPHLHAFYESCGFKFTAAGLLNTKSLPTT